jgi:N-acetylglucosamine kinase-like BadF-type ATPase
MPQALTELVIGIDGGGSQTVALLAEAATGKVVGHGTSGPSNIQSVGVERATQALNEAVAAAFAAAKMSRGTVAATALGMAGVDHPDAVAVVRGIAESLSLARRIEVVIDALLLLEAGTPDGWGLAVIAGTGSIAFGRTQDGRFDRSGGWGYLLGDEGSAYALGLGGARAVARASDGCAQPTVLTQKILSFMGLREPLEMIDAVYRGSWDRARLATIAPIVLTAAEEGDSVADQIVESEASELARTAAGAARKLGLPADRLPLAITGGVILNSLHYRERFLAAVRSLGIQSEPVTPVEEPAEGAIRIARRLV